MDWVWIDILKSDPNPYPSALLCPAHEDIYGHECHHKFKHVGYPGIHGYPWICILCMSA
jgi:hypothetical protein